MRGFFFGVALATLALAQSIAQSGEEVLALAEIALRPAQDMEVIEEMTIVKANGSTETRRLQLYQKGSDKLLVRFLAPADIRGVASLILMKDGEEDLIYLYMPAFRRERRIAGHVKNQNFMGTDLTFEDMAETDYADKYVVRDMSEDDSLFILRLERIDDGAYTSAVMHVDKETFLPMETRFYRQDKLVKTITLDKIEQHGSYWIPHQTVVETPAEGSRTVMKIIEVSYDQGLADSLFTVRGLARFR